MALGIGVIEGFFGRDWGWAARRAQVDWMAARGFGFYIYAPKSDRALRMDWRRPWTDAEMSELAALSLACREAGVAFGVGLSPYEVDHDDWSAERARLDTRLAQIEALGPALLGLLFDDAPGGRPDLAARHLRIARAVLERGAPARLLVCPGYYSDDPVLEQVFGAPPPGYLQDLAQGLPSDVGLFWTGPQVVSRSYPAAHLAEVATRIGRRPLLWDNGAVNDSRALSPFLPVSGTSDRGGLAGLVEGLAINPMNQPHLARLPLAAMAASWQGTPLPFEAIARREASPALAERLVADAPILTGQGLDGLALSERARLRRLYEPHAGDPMADEVLAWLDGAYVFDPACLT